MESLELKGVELEVEVRGSGEPVLLIDMLIADCFVPLVAEPALADGYQLIRYRKRGWVGSTHTPPPVSIRDHAADGPWRRHAGPERAPPPVARSARARPGDRPPPGRAPRPSAANPSR